MVFWVDFPLALSLDHRAIWLDTSLALGWCLWYHRHREVLGGYGSRGGLEELVGFGGLGGLKGLGGFVGLVFGGVDVFVDRDLALDLGLKFRRLLTGKYYD